MNEPGESRGYTLVICEKPDAARRVSEALSLGTAKGSMVEGVQVFTFREGAEDYAVCSGQGHVYGISDPFDERSVYPVFDTEWYSSDLFDDDSASAGRRIAAIRKLGAGAANFVNACDYDVEGETIGFNILRYACGGKEGVARRAKFSTLVREDLVKAFQEARPQANQGLAAAGRARHFIDFVWGVNLSRALSQSVSSSGLGFRTVSMGRVQGPTLSFLVQREREIREFVPIPFWRVTCVLEKEGSRFTAGYSRERVEEKAEAEKVVGGCGGTVGTVASVRTRTVEIRPSPAFNLGDLQRESYRVFRFSPSRTMQIAERLYLSALISYPRTDSQKLPKSINYAAILKGLAGQSMYSQIANQTLGGSLNPVQGSMDDSAHPAIHPTGERPMRTLNPGEASVFDLIVRRFMATFGLPAERRLASASILVGGYEFKLAGGRTVFPGWMSQYGKYSTTKDVELPELVEGESLKVVQARLEEGMESRPSRFNQSTLLEKMEREKIGTKTTRADIISTLVARGYVAGEGMTVTDLGLSVFGTVRRYAPSIASTELTREIEEELRRIEQGKVEGRELLRETVRTIAKQLQGLNTNLEAVGGEIHASLGVVQTDLAELGGCPICRKGKLRIVRSRKTKKRFVGCSSYGTGCHASAPLPQRGTIKATKKACGHCGWPVVLVLGKRAPWRLCVNPSCPEKEANKREV